MIFGHPNLTMCGVSHCQLIEEISYKQIQCIRRRSLGCSLVSHQSCFPVLFLVDADGPKVDLLRMASIPNLQVDHDLFGKDSGLFDSVYVFLDAVSCTCNLYKDFKHKMRDHITQYSSYHPRVCSFCGGARRRGLRQISC